MHLPLLIWLVGDVRRLLHVLRWRLGDVDLRRMHHLLMVRMNHFPSILNCYVGHCEQWKSLFNFHKISLIFARLYDKCNFICIECRRCKFTNNMTIWIAKLSSLFSIRLAFLLCSHCRHFNDTNLQSLSYILAFKRSQKKQCKDDFAIIGGKIWLTFYLFR